MIKKIGMGLAWLALAAAAAAQVGVGFVRQWGSSGSGNGQFHATHACGYSPLMRIYVADEANHRIQYFAMDGTYLGQFGQWGHGTNDIINPVCVAFQGDGTVYVVERDNNRIHVFTPSGGHLGMWGSAGSGPGQFDKPAGAAFAPDGTLYVTDRFNHRVQRFTPSGDYLGQFGGSGTGDGQFNEPFGIAVASDGTVYVGDSQNRRMQYFTAAGAYLGQWGSTGSGDGQFGNASIYNNGPGHVSVDAAGRVYVADPNNYRIQVFTPTGGYLGRVGASYGSGNGAFAFPNAAALAPGWQMYVADEVDDLIQQMTVVIGGITNPAVAGVAHGAAGTIVNVEAIPDGPWQVQRSTDLATWTTWTTVQVPEGLFSATDQAPASAVFYRAAR